MSGSDSNSAACEIARQMREGLESRLLLGTQPFCQFPSLTFTSETRHNLGVSADLSGVPPVARSGPFSWAIRLLRRALQSLLRPWLAMQTRYNRMTLDLLEGLQIEINELKARQPNLSRQSISVDRTNLLQPSETFHAHESVSPCTLEFMFVLSRLPAPPARVLLVGSAARQHARQLENLSYEVIVADLTLSSRPCPTGEIHQTPAPSCEAAFDAVIVLSTMQQADQLESYPARVRESDTPPFSEIARLLRPCGRLILGFDHPPSQDFTHQFKITERIRRMSLNGSLASSPQTTGNLDCDEPASALIVAEKL